MNRLLAPVLAAALWLGALPAQAQEAPPAASPAIRADITLEQWEELPERVRYQVGGPIPVYYEHRQLVRRWAVVTGASVFGGTYLASTMVGVFDPALYPLLIPVAGPWITIATSASEYGFSPPAVWWLTMDGLAQGTGLFLFVWGLTDKQDFLVKKPFGFASNQFEIEFTPVVGSRFTGGLVTGRF